MAFGTKLNLIPTASLLRAVQDPRYAVDIRVPGYAALDELQQRKIKGEKLSLAQAQPPQETVKDQTIAEYQGGLPSPAMPEQMGRAPMPQRPMPQPQQPAPTMMAAQGGIADIPAQYNALPEAAYASGGIVAFAAGGAPEFNFTPESYDMGTYNDLLAKNPYKTLEEIQAEEEARRQARGIDYGKMFARQQEGLASEKEDIKKSLETNKALAGLEWAGEMLKSTSQFFGPGLGAGATAFAKTYGAAEKEFNAANRQLRREENSMELAKANMDMAILKGDRDEYNQNLNRYQSAATNVANLQNKMVDTRNQVGLKKAEEEFGYQKAMDVARVQANSSKETDMKRLVDGQYQALLKKGYPAGPETYAQAQSLAYDMAGKVYGTGKLGIDTATLNAKVTGDMDTAITTAIKNDTTLKALKDKLSQQQLAQDTAGQKATKVEIATKEAEIRRGIEAKYKTAFPQVFSPAGGAEAAGPTGAAGVKPYAPPAPPELPKPAALKEPSPGANKPVQSKYIMDGFVFPDQASLNRYKAAKAKAQSAQ